MLLAISDIHFGKSTPDSERAKEADLLDLLASFDDELEALYLLGDVFDQYVEYRHVVPKGFVRFQAALARLVDSGAAVHYVVGNHDPWHLDYFSRELGVTLHRHGAEHALDDRNVILRHGDEAEAATWIRALLRHRVSMGLFRSLLPADAAYRLTRWTKTRFGSETTDPRTVRRLEGYAGRLLSEGADVVVLGHSHVPVLRTQGPGVYVNAGSWDAGRVYVTLDPSSVALRTWNGRDISVYAFVAAEMGRSPQQAP